MGNHDNRAFSGKGAQRFEQFCFRSDIERARSPTMAMTPAVMSRARFPIGGSSARKRRPNCEWRIRSGSAAMARNGKIEVTPITWKIPWANARKNTNARFFRP